jgi:hypothetical protein
MSRGRRPGRVPGVSDPREVPPSPGTEPRVSEEGERRYREDPGIYAQHRKAGTVPLTEAEIDARIVASAADLAATENPPPLPPFLHELVATFRHRLYRRQEVRSRQLAAYDEGRRMALVRGQNAIRRRDRALGRVRELSSERKRMRSPVTGVTLTQPEMLLLCLLPGMVIEIFGSAPSLAVAFDLGMVLSWLFAAAISGILILAADQLGNMLAAASIHSRRQSAAMAAFLVMVALGAGVWAVVGLAGSREHNIAYEQGSNLAPASSSDGSFESSGDPAPGPQERAPAEAAEAVPSSPDYAFFIPLSILIMATATLVAFRIELAHEWNEISTAIDEFEGDAEGAREAEEQEDVAMNQALTPENEAILDASALVEREHALLSLWLGRFVAEYHRFCAARGKQPRELSMPAIPDPEVVLGEVLRPRTGGRPAGEGPAAGPGPSGGGTNGAGDMPGGDDPPPPPPGPERHDPSPAPSRPPAGGHSPGNERHRPSGEPRGFG